MVFFRLLTSSFLLLCYLHTSTAQKTIKYEGTLSTNFSSAGEENYNYYVDESNGKKLKHGYYKYMLKQTKGFSKLYKTITGNYNKNLKSGVWAYNIKLNDYQEKGKPTYTTATLNLSAAYNNGIPDGKWEYSCNYKEREIISQQNGRIKWDKYQNANSEKIVLHFKNGVLIDTLDCQVPGFSAFGVIDDAGFFAGTWSYLSNNKIEKQEFKNGLMYSYEYLNGADSMLLKSNDNSAYLLPKLEKLESLQKNSPEKLNELNYTTDTTTLLASTQNMLTKAIRENIFANPYLLFSYIEGDDFSPEQLEGGYQLKIVNQLSKSQQQKIDKIAGFKEDFKGINQKLDSKVKGKQISDRSKELVNLMNFYERIAAKYLCISEALCSRIEFDDAKKYCDTACKNTVSLPDGLPQFNSREEALNFFIEDLTNKNNMMEAFYQQIVTLLE